MPVNATRVNLSVAGQVTLVRAPSNMLLAIGNMVFVHQTAVHNA